MSDETTTQDDNTSTKEGRSGVDEGSSVEEMLRREYESIVNGKTETQDPEDADDSSEKETPSEYMVDLPNGKRVDLSDFPEDVREELKSGYLRTSDYTRKTQSLAEQRRELEELRSSFSDATKKAEMYDRFNSLVESNQELFDAIQRAASGQAVNISDGAFGEGADSNAVLDVITKVVNARMSPVEETLGRIERSLRTRETLADLSSKEPLAGELEGEIRQLMEDNPRLSAEHAYKIAAHDRLKSTASEAEIVRRNNAGKASAIAKPGGSEGTPKKFDIMQFPREKRLEAALTYGKTMALKPEMRAAFNR